MGSYLEGGLKMKYIIQKADGSPTDDNAEYFVLRLDEDPHARLAARVYAASVKADNPQFADALIVWLKDIEKRISYPKTETYNVGALPKPQRKPIETGADTKTEGVRT